MSKIRFTKKTADVRRRAKELGYSIEFTGKSHIKYMHPLVAKPIFGSSTPSCRHGQNQCIRMLENALRDLDRALQPSCNQHSAVEQSGSSTGP